QPVAPRPDLAQAANFLHMLRGNEAAPDQVKALDVALILYAEHEFNASTFTARVVCSTESDLHSRVVAAIGALKGRLHGGANEEVMDLLGKTRERKNAERWIHVALVGKELIIVLGKSRVSGCSAHDIEQLQHNRLIRPRARYTGPEVRAVAPLAERS